MPARSSRYLIEIRQSVLSFLFVGGAHPANPDHRGETLYPAIRGGSSVRFWTLDPEFGQSLHRSRTNSEDLGAKTMAHDVLFQKTYAMGR